MNLLFLLSHSYIVALSIFMVFKLGFCMIKRWYIQLISIILLMIIVVSFVRHWQPNQKWEPVTHQDVQKAVYGLATVMASDKYHLYSGVARQVENVDVSSGQTVKKGTPLVHYHDGLVIRAPFDGIVTYVKANAGEVYTTSTQILTLVNTDRLYLQISLDQDAILHIKDGMTIKMAFDTLSDQTFHGHVDSRYSNEQQFYARVNQIDPALPESVLPGMTGNVAIETGTIKAAQFVSLAAIDQDQLTYKVPGEKAKTVSVKTGVSQGNRIQIVTPHLPDDAVVALQG